MGGEFRGEGDTREGGVGAMAAPCDLMGGVIPPEATAPLAGPQPQPNLKILKRGK